MTFKPLMGTPHQPNDLAAYAMELETLVAGANQRADRWRFIANEMGYEPDAHKHEDLGPWLKERIARYRQRVIDEAVQSPPPIMGEGLAVVAGLFLAAHEGIGADSYDGVEPRYRALADQAASMARLAGVKPIQLEDLPSLATPSLPEGMPIMLEMAAADDAQQMWERRWEALKQMYARERCFVDRDGNWGLRDFLDYVGGICGFALATAPASALRMDKSVES